MSDEFAFSQARPTYDPNAFYVAAQDSKGHYERKQIRFPPDVWHRICAVAADPTNPLRNSNDVVRNAVIHQLNRDAMLDDADPAFVRHVADLTMAARVETEMVMAAERKKLIVSTKKLAELAVASPIPERRRVFDMIRVQAVGCSEEVRDEIGAILRLYDR